MMIRRQNPDLRYTVIELGLHMVAGAVASFSLPPYFILPALLSLSLPTLGYSQATSRCKAVMIIGAAGFGWFFASTFWVSHSLMIESPDLWMLRVPLAAALAIVLAAFWGCAAFCAWSVGRHKLARALWLVTFLGIGEWARGFVATGFPWNLPGSVFSVTVEAVQAASVFGVYGLTVVALLVAMAPAFWYLGGRWFAILLMLLPFGFSGGGTMRLATMPEAGGEMPSVRLVQPSVPQAEKWNKQKQPQHLATLIGLSQKARPVPDLVIWPETAFAAFPSRQPKLLAGVAQQATAPGGALLTGMPRFSDERTLLNSAVLVGHDGFVLDSYDKRHLVPFGEYIPFRRFFPFISAFVGPVDFSAGTTNHLMPFAGHRHMQVLICYEVIFSGSVIERDDRPDVMVNLTNDAWFGDTAGPWQHFYMAQMRAVEEGIPMIRVANTGISGAFDAMGRPLGSLQLGAVEMLDIEVPPPLSPPVFARFGHLGFFLLLGLLALLALRLDLGSRFRQKIW